MKILPYFLLVIFLLKITISVESQTPALLKYVLQWPPTFCFQLNSKEAKFCKEPSPQNKFTLHGVMQANEDGFNIKCDYNKDPNDLDNVVCIHTYSEFKFYALTIRVTFLWHCL